MDTLRVRSDDGILLPRAAVAHLLLPVAQLLGFFLYLCRGYPSLSFLVGRFMPPASSVRPSTSTRDETDDGYSCGRFLLWWTGEQGATEQEQSCVLPPFPSCGMRGTEQ